MIDALGRDKQRGLMMVGKKKFLGEETFGSEDAFCRWKMEDKGTREKARVWVPAIRHFGQVGPLLPSTLSRDPSRAAGQGSLTSKMPNGAGTTSCPGRYGLVNRR